MGPYLGAGAGAWCPAFFPAQETGKKGDGAEGRWACRRNQIAQAFRDSFAGAACAGPQA